MVANVNAQTLHGGEAETVSITLKLLLALTQDSPLWSKAFLAGVSPYMALVKLMLDGGRAIEKTQEVADGMGQPKDTEILNLALGCLFNVVQGASDGGKPMVDLRRCPFIEFIVQKRAVTQGKRALSIS